MCVCVCGWVVWFGALMMAKEGRKGGRNERRKEGMVEGIVRFGLVWFGLVEIYLIMMIVMIVMMVMTIYTTWHHK